MAVVNNQCGIVLVGDAEGHLAVQIVRHIRWRLSVVCCVGVVAGKKRIVCLDVALRAIQIGF